MSMYHLTQGVTPATFLILPMLGKHPDEYPRFRDCFTSDAEHPEYNDHIHVFTRAGGGNRESYEAEIAELQSHPNYVTDFDDSFDSTYASFVFTVPEQWKVDFDLLTKKGPKELSAEYKAELYRVYPKLKEKFDELFS